MYQVQKRNGKIIDFDLSKIVHAIKLAFEAQEKQYNDSVIDFLALKVTADFEPKIKDGKITVEDIQDSVEAVLCKPDTPMWQKHIFFTVASAKSSAYEINDSRL